MTSHQYAPIPQALQQHGGIPKPAVEPVSSEPEDDVFDLLKAEDKGSVFTTLPVFESRILKAS